MRNIADAAALVLLILFGSACGGSPAQPSATTPPPSTGATSAPAIKLDVKADELGSRDAVAALSEVVADASASTGAGPLTFAIDFGDGFVSTAGKAQHVYTAPGTFTITATITDQQGRKASASSPVTVTTVTGRWFEAEYVQRSKRVEVRHLTVTNQDGLSIRGQYQVTGQADRTFTGTLSAPRNARIALSDGATLDGTIPGRLNDQSDEWVLQAGGDTVNGERLSFHAIVGDPSGPPPDADMKFSFDTDDPDAWAPFAALTPVHIDGSLSRGTNLTDFVEFGDGFASSGPQATRVVDPPHPPSSPLLTARLTVVDRFGRSDSESHDYFMFVLGGSVGIPAAEDYWVYTDSHGSYLAFRFLKRNGVNYEGEAHFNETWVTSTKAAFATLSGTRDVHIAVPELGLEYRGTIKMGCCYSKMGCCYIAVMTVVQSGGADNGRTWSLSRKSPY